MGELWLVLLVASWVLAAYLIIVWLPGLRGNDGRQVGWGIVYLGLGAGSFVYGLEEAHAAWQWSGTVFGLIFLAMAAYKFWGPVRA